MAEATRSRRSGSKPASRGSLEVLMWAPLARPARCGNRSSRLSAEAVPGVADPCLLLAREVAGGDLLDDVAPTPHLEEIRRRRTEIERVVRCQRSLVLARLPAEHEDATHRVLEPLDDLARQPGDETPDVETDRRGRGRRGDDVGRGHESAPTSRTTRDGTLAMNAPS